MPRSDGLTRSSISTNTEEVIFYFQRFVSPPSLAVVGVGAWTAASYRLRRINVVEHVLLAQSTSGISVPATLVLQTEEGQPTGASTSFA